jgi:hypothetical protein
VACGVKTKTAGKSVQTCGGPEKGTKKPQFAFAPAVVPVCYSLDGVGHEAQCDKESPGLGFVVMGYAIKFLLD